MAKDDGEVKVDIFPVTTEDTNQQKSQSKKGKQENKGSRMKWIWGIITVSLVISAIIIICCNARGSVNSEGMSR